MQTVFDWVTVAIFAALVVLFLQRSVTQGTVRDSIWHYIPAAVGCALANYLGNEGQEAFAVAIIAAVILYSVLVLKPFGNLRS